MRAKSLRTATAAAVLTILVAACTSTADSTTTVSTVEPVPTVTSTIAITSTTTAAPSTTAPTTTASVLMTQQEAYQFIFQFDPVTGDAAALAAALGVTGPRPALNLPHLLEVGSAEVQSTVLASLASGDPWSIPTLLAMHEYGMPSGTPTQPAQWPTGLAFEIANALWESANAAYGPLGELMTDLNRTFVAHELELCAREDCDWGTAWYLPPSAVANPVGTMENDMFTGTVTIVSDTGAGDEASIVMQALHRWVPIDGFLAEVPAFGIDIQVTVLFDGMVVNEPGVTLFGWAEEGTTISIGSESTGVDGNWWELTVDVPVNGLIEVVGTAPDGTARAESLQVNYMPTLERTLGYIVGIEKSTGGGLALEVDYAQWFSGEEATIAAREDGVIGPDDFIENDYYIRNENPQLRIIAVDDFAPVRLIDAARSDLESVTVSVTDFARILDSGDDGRWFGAASEYTPYWFMVDGDAMIYQVEQQYIP